MAAPYSVTPSPLATVSTPLTWEEIESGIDSSHLTIASVPPRVQRVGDLFKPLLMQRSRIPLEALLLKQNDAEQSGAEQSLT